MLGPDVAIEIQPAAKDRLWSCPACTFDNKPKRRRCEMCETPRPPQDDDEPEEETKIAVVEEKKSVIQQMAIENKWFEADFQPKSLQKVGNQMMIRILDFCDPGDIVSVGTASRWCQTISVRPELWRSLFDRDHEHFLDELPDRKKLLASSLIDSVLSSRRSAFLQPGWERDGGGKRAYLSVLRGLNERCDAKELEIKQSRLRRQQEKHESRMDTILENTWWVLGLGFGLFVITLILLVIKLVYPHTMNWAGVLGPLASAFALHSVYLVSGGLYASVACCLHPRAFFDPDAAPAGLFWMGVISIPWGMFPILLILEIEDVIHWTYSYIFISLYVALFGFAIFWTCWLYIDNGRYCSSSTTFPAVCAFAIVALILGLFIPMGLKLDGLYDGPWVVVWTPVWIALLLICIGACFFTYVCFEESEKSKLVFWFPVLALLAQFVLIPLKLDFPEMCDWVFILMPLIVCMCSIVCACCVASGVMIYDAAR